MKVLLALLLLATRPVQAAEGDGPPWYAGRTVALVTLEAPEGGLPRENLEPLLRVSQGMSLDPSAVRQDVILLYQTGEFAAVEAHAEPWLAMGPDGEAVDGIWLVYRVYPASRLGRVKIEGVPARMRRRLIEDAGLQVGQRLLGAEDLDDSRDRIQSSLLRAGYGDAEVQLDTARRRSGELDVRVTVQLGTPARYGEVVVVGDPQVGEERIHRWLRKGGIKSRRRIETEGMGSARKDLVERLQEAGFLQARASFVMGPADAEGTTDLSVLVESGPALEIKAYGRGLPARARLHEVLGLYAGDRLGPDLGERAQTALLAWFDRGGFLDAEIDTDVVPLEHGDTRLILNARRGPRHSLQRLEILGAQAFSPAYLAGALKEADPKGLGSRRVSQKGIATALEGVREFYRGQGYLDARLSLTELRHGVWSPLSRLRNHLPTVLSITVEEGVQTRLVALEFSGGAGAEGELARAAQADLVGQAFSPSTLELRVREMVDLLRSKGWLNADADVQTTLSEDRSEARASVTLTPGQPLRLRSIVLSGNRRTRRSVLERELALEVGEAITPEKLADTRSNLYALDLFKRVSLDLVGEDDRARDLVLTVQEKPNITLEMGGGFSTDQGLRATARASHRNVGGIAHRISLLGQAGLAWQGDTWRIDTAEPVWRAALRYQAPEFPRRGLSFVNEILFNEAVREPGFRLSRSGFSGGIKLEGAGGRLEAQVDYRLQRRVLEDLDPGALVAQDPWLAHLDGQLSEGTIGLPSNARWVSGPSFVVVYDARDDRFNPSKGFSTSSFFEVGDGLLGDPVALRGELRLEQLIPAGPLTLALGFRGGLGWAAGADTTLAVEDRYTLGGAGTVRGFKLGTIGPANFSRRPDIDYPSAIGPLIDGTVLADSPSHWVSTGGDSMGAGSFEIRVPTGLLGLPGGDRTWLVFFADAGRVGFLDPSVQTTSQTEGRDPALRVGLGTGLLISTPVGPAAIDLAINPWRLTERDEALLHIHVALGTL